MTKEEKRVYMRNYQNERRARLKKEHKCVYCQKQDAFTLAGNVACEKCLDRQCERNKILYQKRNEVNDDARVKAIKEFAEYLKGISVFYVYAEYIDNAVKEMTEREGANEKTN